jgi:hypothetical protein
MSLHGLRIESGPLQFVVRRRPITRERSQRRKRDVLRLRATDRPVTKLVPDTQSNDDGYRVTPHCLRIRSTWTNSANRRSGFFGEARLSHLWLRGYKAIESSPTRSLERARLASVPILYSAGSTVGGACFGVPCIFRPHGSRKETVSGSRATVAAIGLDAGEHHASHAGVAPFQRYNLHIVSGTRRLRPGCTLPNSLHRSARKHGTTVRESDPREP